MSVLNRMFVAVMVVFAIWIHLDRMKSQQNKHALEVSRLEGNLRVAEAETTAIAEKLRLEKVIMQNETAYLVGYRELAERYRLMLEKKPVLTPEQKAKGEEIFYFWSLYEEMSRMP